jgi:4-oxalocrotonate tautomerase
MPFIQIEMLTGRTIEQKRAMVKQVTEALASTIDCKPERVKIIIREISKENVANGGVLILDRQD